MGKFDARISRRRQCGGDSSAFCPSPSVLFLRVVVVVASVLAARSSAFASGEERTTVGEDLEIRTDTRWAGGTLGGYLPVRVAITNHDLARTLRLEVTPSDFTRGATVRRVVGVNQDATVHFTLSIPLTAFRLGTFRVYDQRGELKSHERLIGGAASLDVEAAPAMLVVSSRPVNCAGYIRAAGSSPSGLRFRKLPDPEASTLVQVLPPDSLPDSWIDYSGLDFVAISRDDLAALAASSRSAVLKWVACGGNLIVYQAGKTPQDVTTLERLLDMPGNAAVGARWTESDWRKRQRPLRRANSCSDWSAPFPINCPMRRSTGPRS